MYDVSSRLAAVGAADDHPAIHRNYQLGLPEKLRDSRKPSEASPPFDTLAGQQRAAPRAERVPTSGCKTFLFGWQSDEAIAGGSTAGRNPAEMAVPYIRAGTILN